MRSKGQRNLLGRLKIGSRSTVDDLPISHEGGGGRAESGLLSALHSLITSVKPPRGRFGRMLWLLVVSVTVIVGWLIETGVIN